jgi:DNA-binding transcriptional ArsR family regulator
MVNAERALNALGNPTRRRVLTRLQRGDRSVEAIAQGMHVTRSAVSQHLKVLKSAGLVVVRAEGTRRLYAVDVRGVEAVRHWIDGLWDKTLVAFKEAAERAAAKERETP